jgi:hypothetical protein
VLTIDDVGAKANGAGGPNVTASVVNPGSKKRFALVIQILGAVLLVAAIVVGVFSSHASATGLSTATVTVKLSPGGALATSPLSNHQVIDVSVAPNSTLSWSSLEGAGFPSGAVTIKVLQCAYTGGNLPQKPTECEPETLESVAGAEQTGSVEVKGYTVYALPDAADLGASNGTVCDATHECVLGIFSNQNDFSKPHVFSAPFLMSSTSAAATTSGSTPSTASTSGSTAGGASAEVSVPPATLANTGGPTLWPWLLGIGCAMLLGGSALRYRHRATERGQS